MTASVAPETIYGDLLQEIATCYLANNSVGELALRKLRSRAEQLMAVDAAGALEVRGHTYLLAGKVEDGLGLLRRAIALRPRSAELIVRTMQGLQHVAESDLVAELFFQFRHVLEGNVTATRETRQIMASHGYMQVAHELRSDLAKMNAQIDEVTYAQGEHLLIHFDSNGITDADTAPVVGFVRKFLHDAGVRLHRVGIVVVPGEGGVESALLYELGVIATVERAAEIEWDLFGALEAEGFDIELNRRILFSVVSDSVKE